MDVRHGILNTALVFAVPAAVVLAFPPEVFSFRSSETPDACPASAAFVVLTPAQERTALVAARTAWQSDGETYRNSRPRLPLGELPEAPQEPLLGTGAVPRPADAPAPLSYRPGGWEPSLRAAPPVPFEPEPAASPAPAFSRDELLRIN